MKFVGKVVVEVEVDAQDSKAAKRKVQMSLKHKMYGVKKEILIEPDWD